MLDSVIRVKKMYYPQTLLEECKYTTKKNKVENHVNDDLKSGSFGESDNESNSESENGFNNEYDHSFNES